MKGNITMDKNYYEILEIDRNASPEIIDKAYKTLAKKYHPDLQDEAHKKESEEKFKIINEAYQVLSNPEQKALYDQNLVDSNISQDQYEEMYRQKPIIHSKIEEIAKQVHSTYDPEDMKNGLKRFYQLEYNKKSSRAVAIHLKYKFYSILGNIYDGNFEEDFENNVKKILEVYKKVIHENKRLQEILIQNEHERWNAYTRADGFQLIKAEEVKKYKEITKSSKHMVAKLHPALVQFEELKNIQEELHENYIQSDIDIIENLEKILKKEIYTKE